jgi:hypothetical protein
VAQLRTLDDDPKAPRYIETTPRLSFITVRAMCAPALRRDGNLTSPAWYFAAGGGGTPMGPGIGFPLGVRRGSVDAAMPDVARLAALHPSN